ncbi:MAG: tRNA (guanosine(18)-2'-O)-methyltransferase TrmH [Gammaproteobacteria bacterium]
MTPERFAKLRRVMAGRQPDLTILAENVHKSHNIAAIIRTCDAVGILDAHAVSETGEMRRHHMVSGGSRRWVPVHFHPSVRGALDALRGQGFRILAAHQSDTATDYREMDYTAPTAILLGSELVGVSESAAADADGHVMIPMEGMVESLNVSVAAALILYEARRQRRAAGMYDKSRVDPQLARDRLFEWAYPKIAARCREKSVPYPPLSADGPRNLARPGSKASEPCPIAGA